MIIVNILCIIIDMFLFIFILQILFIVIETLKFAFELKLWSKNLWKIRELLQVEGKITF